jgi:hypothetical protein
MYMIETTEIAKESVSDFLARGGQITQCAPKEGPKNPLTVHVASVMHEKPLIDDVGRMVVLAVKRYLG